MAYHHDSMLMNDLSSASIPVHPEQHEFLMTDGEDYKMTDDFDENGKKRRRPSPDLDVYTKWAIVVRVIQETNRATKRLKVGSLDMISEEFSVSKRTVQRIHTEYQTQREQGVLVPDMSSKKPERCGAESKLTEVVAENIRQLKNKFKNKMTARGMADAYEAEYGTKMPYMTLYRYEKKLGSDIIVK